KRIEELGVRLDEIDIVVHTHLHPDHCGWNDSENVEPIFPKAILFVSRVELDHWEHADYHLDERAQVARRATAPLKASGRVATFDGELEVTTGITTVPTPGHTPGHTSLLLASQGEHLLITGDAAHHPVHLEHHDWIPGVDLDPRESETSRH